MEFRGVGLRGGSRIFERGGGSILGLHAKKGGPGGGKMLGPMLKSLHRGPKGGGGPDPLDPPLDPPLGLQGKNSSSEWGSESSKRQVRGNFHDWQAKENLWGVNPLPQIRHST